MALSTHTQVPFGCQPPGPPLAFAAVSHVPECQDGFGQAAVLGVPMLGVGDLGYLSIPGNLLGFPVFGLSPCVYTEMDPSGGDLPWKLSSS